MNRQGAHGEDSWELGLEKGHEKGFEKGLEK